MPNTIGTVITAGMAKLHELQTVYSVRDLYVMIEIDRVNKANRKALKDRNRPREK